MDGTETALLSIRRSIYGLHEERNKDVNSKRQMQKTSFLRQKILQRIR